MGLKHLTLSFYLMAFLAGVNAGKCKPVHDSKPYDIYLDFDGTITIDDTLEALANTAYNAISPEDLEELPTWRQVPYFSEEYYKDYNEFSKTQVPRTSAQEEVAFRVNPALRAVESASFDRVQASGIFNFTTSNSLADSAATVHIRPGVKKLIEATAAANAPVRIISVNWSPKWIRKVLEANVGSKLADRIEIYCAEIIPGKVGAAPHRRDFPLRVHTGGDKLDLIRKLQKKSSRKSVYVGDSKTDLPALLDVDVGIMTEGDGGLVGSLEGWGMKTWELTNENVIKHRSGQKGLFFLDDFEQIVKSGLLGRKYR